MQWLEDEWNQPSRTDHYLMRVAMETRLMNITEGHDKVKLEDFKVPFKFEDKRDKVSKEDEWHPFEPLTEEQAAKVHFALRKYQVTRNSPETRNSSSNTAELVKVVREMDKAWTN